jgi:cytochrome c553
MPRTSLPLLAFAIALVMAGGVSAAPAVSVGAMLAEKGNANGAAPCMSCHGARGEGTAAAGFPRLAGLSGPYMERQLAAFADGSRESPVMAPIAKALSAEERRAASAYYAALPFAQQFTAPADAAEAGAVLATRGRWEKEPIPGCEQCHGPNGVGVGDAFPPLAGQPAAYIAQQLEAWRDGKRPPGPLELMRVVASRLSPQDIDAVAKYFGAVTPRATGKAATR